MTSVMLGDRVLADKPHPKMGYRGCLGLWKQDVSYLVRKYMTELYHCQQKVKHLTQQTRNSHDTVEFTLKQQVKDSEGRLKKTCAGCRSGSGKS